MSSSPEDEPSQKDRILAQASAKIEEAQQESEAAKQARERCEGIEDPEEKQKILDEAAQHEKKAKALIGESQRLQSGIWQGGLGGAGIGAGLGTGIGAGLGAVVTAVVGGVAAIPTAGLGFLLGAGAGAIHGPWYKLGGKDKEQSNEEGQQKATEGSKATD